MGRIRLTQVFPCLLPLRKRQKKLFFYAKMRLDGNHYAEERSEQELPYLLFQTSWPLYSPKIRYDRIYQENKAFNLELAEKVVDQMVIRPGETFSFWRAVRFANREIPYRDGPAVSDGRLQALPGGGLCLLSTLLFWLFLHTQLTITERHGHGIDFQLETPVLSGKLPSGVDSAVAEGWLDLKVRNDTRQNFQIRLAILDGRITGQIFSDTAPSEYYRIINGDVERYRKNGKVYERAEVVRETYRLPDRECIGRKVLYQNDCEIGGIDPMVETQGAEITL